MADFDLEKAIAAWRRRLRFSRVFLADDLDELEAHLRDHIDRLVQEEASLEQAFHRAEQRLGTRSILEAAYRNVRWGRRKRRLQLNQTLLNEADMLTNYIKIALRNFIRHKGYTFINIFGLAIGMACCLLILLYVRDELRYDRYHVQGERIYRLIRETSAYTAAPMGPALTKDLPGVERSVRFDYDEVVIRQGEQQFEETLFFADSTIFNIFSFDLLRGSPETALTRPDALVISETAARKYFGDADPMGKTLFIEDDEPIPFTVTGVVKDLPRHSHFRFDLLASFKVIEQASNRMENWDTNWLFTYLLASNGVTAEQIEAELPAFFERHTGEAWELFRIQPLHDIHLHSAGLEYDIAPQGNIAYVYIFSAIALLVLLIACINFMNLATARSMQRAREVGMRKVLGAKRGQLVRQFMGESFVMAFGGLLLAVGLAWLMLPAFGNLAEKNLTLTWSDAGFVLLALAGITLFVGLLAGSYPAFFLAAFRPVRVLKGELERGSHAAWFRRGLVVFQFAISLFLIIGTLVVGRQLGYLKNAQLGFDSEQVVVLPLDDLDARHEVIKQQVLQHPGVLSASASDNLPGHGVSDYYYRPEGLTEGEDDLPVWDTYFIDPGFVETLHIELAEGRNFASDRTADENAFLLNEAAVARAVEVVGPLWQNPVGRQLDFYTPGSEGWSVAKSGTVVGVVKDFHFRSLHEDIGPLVLQMAPFRYDNLVLKVSTSDLPGTLAFLEQQWQAFGTDQPFDYFFLDADFNRLYQAEERVGQVFGVFAALALLIACLGLFGLAAFMAEQRTKEIGIRKVLGASAGSLVVLLSKQFTTLVALAFVIAAPLAYVIMNQWLADFAYRIEIAWPIFLIAGSLSLAVALLTVSYQAVRAARANPVKSLRYE